MPVMLGLAATLGAAALAGCAPLAKDAGFSDVRVAVAERGITDVRWRPDDETVAREIGPLLAAPLTQDTAVRVALLNNRRLRATFETLGVAQADYARAATWHNPVLDLEAKFGDGGGGTIIEGSVAVSLLDLLLLPARRREAAATFAGEQARVGGAIVDLATDVRLAWLDACAAESMMAQRRTIESAAALSAELAQRVYAAGNIPVLRVALEQAELEQTRLDTADAEANVAQTRHRLGDLLGTRDDAWKLAVEIPSTLPKTNDAATQPASASTESFETQFTLARERSFSLAAARDARRAAAVRAKVKPLIDELEVGVAFEREPGDEWFTGPALSVPIPIFDWGAIGNFADEAVLRGALATEQARLIELANAVRFARHDAARRRAAALRYRTTILPLEKQVVNETLKNYNAMATDAFALFSARRREGAATARAIEADHAAAAAQTKLDALLTGGSLRDSSLTSNSVTNAVRLDDSH